MATNGTHGTRAMYAEGCRCDKCVRAERWVKSGFHPEKWGKSREPWNKGRSKYANDEERAAAEKAARPTWPSSSPERQREYAKRYRHSAKGRDTARRYRQEHKRPKDTNRSVRDKAYYVRNAAKIKKRQYDRMVEMKNDPNDERHGSVYGYNNGCRCERCKKARSEYLNEWRRNNRLRVGCTTND